MLLGFHTLRLKLEIGDRMIEIGIGPNVFAAEFFTTWVMSWHGFFSFVAVATAVVLVGRWAPLRGVEPDAIYTIAIWAIIGGVLGARLVHVVDYWGDVYSRDVGQIFAIWSGGIGIWGGILGGFVGGTTAAMVIRQPVGVIADLTAPALLFVQSIGRLGDIVNGEHCAKATDFLLGFAWTHPDTMASPSRCAAGYISPEGGGIAVHPVILYEMLWNTISLAIIWQLRGRLKPDGMLFALYLVLYSVGRFGITFMRQDRVWALGLQEAQYIAIAVLVVTVPLLIARARPVARAVVWATPVQRGTRAEKRRRDSR